MKKAGIFIVVAMMFACVEAPQDSCGQIAADFWEIRDAYDAYVAEWEALPVEERQQLPLLIWHNQDPDQRAMRLSEFTAMHKDGCPYLDRVENMERYR